MMMIHGWPVLQVNIYWLVKELHARSPFSQTSLTPNGYTIFVGLSATFSGTLLVMKNRVTTWEANIFVNLVHNNRIHPNGISLVSWHKGRHLIWGLFVRDTSAPSYWQLACTTCAVFRKNELEEHAHIWRRSEIPVLSGCVRNLRLFSHRIYWPHHWHRIEYSGDYGNLTSKRTSPLGTHSNAGIIAYSALQEGTVQPVRRGKCRLLLGRLFFLKRISKLLI